MTDKSEPPAEEHPYTLIAVQLALIMLAVPTVRYVFRHGYITQADIEHFIAQFGSWAAPGFVMLLAAGLLVFVPPAILVGTGSLIFGSERGAVYSLLGVSLGVCAAFLLGRHLLADFARRRKQGRLKQINQWLTMNGTAFTFVSRLMFFANPTFNYASSLTAIRFRDYAIGSVLGVIPGVLIFSHLFRVIIFTRSPLDILRHPAFLSMLGLRLCGVALFKGLTIWYGRRKLNETTASEEVLL
ncbi:MAG: VTT domain-containing protein [Acidobacteriota bacterium]|nr:VTT domain-containing protein [Blastocatellia bacterium]MDW8239998.1 VTT domain-containing protein [Acidobacteriota bacterium]